jgi:hypothetical protein
MSAADVTICIPTWQAEPFIARTLACARAQTHKDLRILVSVDQCTDGTEAICRSQAAEDSRIDIRVQKERLGWSRNANFLLDQVDTEFCFLYFHDDIIAPNYTERLRQTLLDSRDVYSAHCDVELFGDKQAIYPGIDCDGKPADRLIRLLIATDQWVPLRGLFRSELIAQGQRFPVIAGDGFWRFHPFMVNLVAAGPAKRVPELLYRLWDRPKSMTKQWGQEISDSLISGQQQSARLCLEIIRRLRLPKAEQQIVVFCLYLCLMTWTRHYAPPGTPLVAPDVISPAFKAPPLPPDASSVGADLFEEVLRAYGTLLWLEAKHARQQGNLQSALLNTAAALSLNPTATAAHSELGKMLLAEGHKMSAAAVGQRIRMLRDNPKA